MSFIIIVFNQNSKFLFIKYKFMISILNFNSQEKSSNIDSPKSQLAMNKLGYSMKNLIQKSI